MGKRRRLVVPTSTAKTRIPRGLRRGALLAVGSLVVFGLGAGCRAAGPADVSETAGARYLEQAGAEWDELFNSGQLVQLAGLYSDDAVSMPFNAPTINGRQALLAEFERFLHENDRVRHETVVDEVLATPEWGIERARYTLTYTPQGSAAPVIETGRHVMCRKWLDGRWQIVWEIFNTDQPAP